MSAVFISWFLILPRGSVVTSSLEAYEKEPKVLIKHRFPASPTSSIDFSANRYRQLKRELEMVSGFIHSAQDTCELGTDPTFRYAVEESPQNSSINKTCEFRKN